jgi:hypothetical protein
MAADQLRVFGYADAGDEWPRSLEANSVTLCLCQGRLRETSSIGAGLHILDWLCKFNSREAA